MLCRTVCSLLSLAAVLTAAPKGLNARFGLPESFSWPLRRVATSPEREGGGPRDAPDILSAAACHAGAQRLLLKIGFAEPPAFANAHFIVYLDLDDNPDTGRTDKSHRGVDVMVTVKGDSVEANPRNPSYQQTKVAGWVEGRDLWLALDAPLREADGQVEFGIHLLSQRQGGASDSTPHVEVRVPAGKLLKLAAGELAHGGSLRALSDYRYTNDQVKLLPLGDKGLLGKDIVPAKPLVLRARPALPLEVARPGVAAKAGSAKLEEVAVDVLEEAGVARPAWISFGLPLAAGALYDPSRVGLVGPGGEPVSIQTAGTCRWPDGSLRWVRVAGQLPLRANERAACQVRFGNDVAPQALPPMQVERSGDLLVVRDGANRFEVDVRRFDLLHGIVLAGRKAGGVSPDGVVLVDELGRRFTTVGVPPTSVAVEERGPLQVVVRVAGDYADADGKRFMSYLTRLTFRRGSSRVGISHTHINTHTDTEFADIRSLSLDLVGGAAFTGLQGQMAEAGQTANGTSLSQWTADQYAANGAKPAAGRLSGAFAVDGPQKAGLVLRDCWQRWPKGIGIVDGAIRVALLPELPDKAFGEAMPHYLLFPFASGLYRTKWGMAFTEELTVDFAGTDSLAEMRAESGLPVVPVLPATYYAQTKAMGRLSVPAGKQFAHWDAYVKDGFTRHMRRKEQYREYGFLNYGDWYGERGRNWGNNEYDLAHGLFEQFARTGDRAYFRWARLAARHQADVDCVHAYPDPAYVGANHQHSIGHTGTWSQGPKRATWTHRYDMHTTAENGHTWTEGMVDSWWLTGDARAMESAIGVGEHIAGAMAPQFKHLGTHERSAGWSLKAVLAVYAGLPDPAYLEAARKIAAVAFREQKPDEGGAWPHLLPLDHAGGHAGAEGNNLFLIGVLLEGLKDYHEATGDPQAAQALVSGVDWVLKSFDSQIGGWPYSASRTGEPYYTPSTGLNLLVIDSVAYVGVLTGQPKYGKVVAQALRSVLVGRAPDFGKSLAQRLVYTGSTLAMLQERLLAGEPDGGREFLADDGFLDALAYTPDAARFSVRSPTLKVFHVRSAGAAPVLLATRRPHGARPKEMENGTLVVRGADGAEVARKEFSTDHPYECRIPLAAGKTCRVEVTDDERSVWDLGGENVNVVAEVVKGYSIGGVGRARYHFFVPTGCQELSVVIEGVHTGPFGGAVVDPGGKLVALHRGVNEGKTQLAWATEKTPSAKTPPVATLRVRPSAADCGKIWDLVLWAQGDIRCSLDGVPPLLSCSRGDWFLPNN